MSLAADDLQRIAIDVWRHLLDQEVAPGARGPTELIACVRLSGAFRGSLLLLAPRAVAVRAAVSMFGHPAAGVDAAAARDVFGELANIVAGHVKALLPAPTELALPEVVEAGGHCQRSCGYQVLAEAVLVGPDGAFILQVNEDLG